MDITSFSSASLRSIISLVEKRERLVAELAKVDASLNSALADGGEVPFPLAKRRGPKPKGSTGKPRKGKRGALKDAILAELKAAGKVGVAVRELAAKLGVKNQNIHVWFHTTGKKLGLKKLGPGKYAI